MTDYSEDIMADYSEDIMADNPNLNLMKELRNVELLEELEHRLDQALSGSKFTEVLKKFNAFEGFEIYFKAKPELSPDDSIQPIQLFVMNCCQMSGGLKCPWPR
jgi:hypothetical protein